MKDLALVANLALTIRVAVVGGFLIILPRITRKGLLFGAYVGEETTDGEVARRLRADWPLGCALVMLLSLGLGYGLSLVGWPMTGNLIGTATLILASFGLYVGFHIRARRLAPPETARQAAMAAASLQGGSTPGAGLAWFALVFCLVVSVANFAYAIFRLEPGWSDRTFFQVTFMPGLNLWVSPFVAVLAVLAANAKRSLRGGSGGRSVEVQQAFRATVTRVLSLVAIVMCTVLTLWTLEMIRSAEKHLEGLSWRFWSLAGVTFLFIVGSMILIAKRYGQGGALQEKGSSEARLTDGLADNAHWVFGLFYVDPDDPSIMVESRFGLGYTFNYGNRTAILILVSFLGLAGALIVFWLVGAAL
jgi:uncharacterized membrane protein